LQRIDNPVPIYLDESGNLLFNGKIYIGVANQDPRSNPVSVFWDGGLTEPAAQPLRTQAGMIVNGGNVGFIFTSATDYSMAVYDSDDELVWSIPSAAIALGAITSGGTPAPSYQPLDSDLTAIAALATTSFGRSLLTLANSAALKSAAGVTDGLAKTGGTITGDIKRSGAGTYVYHADATMTSGRIFLTAAGASDPTSLPGDIWLTY